MKYVITDRDEAEVGREDSYHFEIARDLRGKVIRAGHCEKKEDGSWDVWGRSIGYQIDSKPEDGDVLKRLVK